MFVNEDFAVFSRSFSENLKTPHVELTCPHGFSVHISKQIV